jgi:hypothetical protein
MKYQLRVVKYLAFLLLCFSCTNKSVKPLPETINPVKKIESISLTGLNRTEYYNQLNTERFRPQFINHRNKLWIAFLLRNMRQIKLFQFNNPTVTDYINIPATDSLGSLYIKDSLFCFVKLSGRRMAYYILKGDSLFFEKSFILPPFNEDKFYKTGTCCLQVINPGNPSALINFGTHQKTKNQYLDPEANLLLFKNGAAEAVKTGHYPAGFFSHRQYYSDALFTADGEGNIYFTHELHDSIYKMTVNGQITAAAALEKNETFLEFDEKQYMNMAYIRKYSIMTEMNVNIHCLSNNNIVVLKKLAQDDIKARPRYKYFVLNNQLQVKFADTVRHGCFTRFLDDYKNGFVLLNDSLKSAYYYEIN